MGILVVRMATLMLMMRGIAVKSAWLAIVGLVTLFLAVVGGSPLLVLIVGGFLGIVVIVGPTRVRTALIAFVQATSSMPAAPAALPASPGLLPIFLIFVKIGSIVFGSGYVLLVFLHADLVERHAWLTQRQLLDAVAVGQVTPGPVFTTATFLGYLLRGHPAPSLPPSESFCRRSFWSRSARR